MSRFPARLLTVAGLAALVVGLTAGLAAGPATAHVSASAGGAVQGGFAVISFQLPTESETASTVGLKVQFPADQPLADVSVRPHPGWTYKITTAKLATPIKTGEGEDVTEAVSIVDWKAASAATGIKPGEFDEFQVSAGPLPKADSMTFKAIQVYSDGKEVAWVEEAAPGSNVEPEHPAPAIALAAASDADGSAQPSSPSPAPSAATSAVAAPPVASSGSSGAASSGSVVGAYVVGALGLLAGLAGLAFGLAARRGSRSATPATVAGSEGQRTEAE